MCNEDRMDTRLFELLHVGWIALVSDSLNFESSTAVVVLSVRYDENRTTSYRKNVRLFVRAPCIVDIRSGQSVMH